jgi:DNA-binding protein H-NS
MYRAGSKHHRWEFQGMARNGDFEKMSYADLTKMQADIERMKAERHLSERSALKAKLEQVANDAGFDIHELFGKGRKSKGKGSVAVKYRDKDGNTWTGRGRMPRWLTAATKGGKAKKEDFLVA